MGRRLFGAVRTAATNAVGRLRQSKAWVNETGAVAIQTLIIMGVLVAVAIGAVVFIRAAFNQAAGQVDLRTTGAGVASLSNAPPS